MKCGLASRVNCFTVHGLVSRVAKKVCNDDHKLNQVVRDWDWEASQRRCDEYSNNEENQNKKYDIMFLDLLMLDEAQDLRPSFYKALSHIIQKSVQKYRKNVQMCIVGDPKQMLYDFPTYGSDKATSQYMEQPQQYWGQFTHPLPWISTTLSTSYRLTPNVATFVNVLWGTNIKGGNTKVPNIPVEYICRYPYPPTYRPDPNKLSTSILSGIIDEHGAENVMFLAQSVKSEACPIRVHVNALMKEKNALGKQNYNFHIKESLRGFEGATDLRNKVRVWTFCGSKGCEADCVVVFNVDMRTTGRVDSLNQIGVALSRARKRLVVIHGKSYEKGELSANAYYPMMGDSPGGLDNVVICGDEGKPFRYNVPAFEGRREKILKCRSQLTKQAMCDLSKTGVICLKRDGGILPYDEKSGKAVKQKQCYRASEFSYFAASEEQRFLAFGNWVKESGVRDRIHYATNVKFETTKEDVSALYGEALTYMLQWEREGYCPNIETVLNGMLLLERFKYYSETEVRDIFNDKKFVILSPEHEERFKSFFGLGKERGDNLVDFFNSGLVKVQYKLEVRGREIFLRVKAEEGDDEHWRPFQDEVRSVYQESKKATSQWVYLANAVMAFGAYHEKWKQIGTDAASYDRWVESSALLEGLSRLRNLMQAIPQSTSNSPDQGGEYESEVLYTFIPPLQCNGGRNSNVEIVSVMGICDWIGRGLVSAKGHTVDLLEIKFVQELSNVNRIQVLVYCALLSLESDRSCSGMLFNARTGEVEVCKIDRSKAEQFLLEISQFKLSGTAHEQPRQATIQASKKRKICSIPSSEFTEEKRKVADSFQGPGSFAQPIVID